MNDTTSTSSTTTTATGMIARVAVGLAGGLIVASLLSGGPAAADSSDYNLWRTHFGTSGAVAGDGDTDGNDFLVWQRSFGRS